MLVDIVVGFDGESGIEFVFENIAHRLVLIDTGFHIIGHLILYGPHHFSVVRIWQNAKIS